MIPFRVVRLLMPALLVQGGHLFLSDNLANVSGERLDLILATGRVRF